MSSETRQKSITPDAGGRRCQDGMGMGMGRGYDGTKTKSKSLNKSLFRKLRFPTFCGLRPRREKKLKEKEIISASNSEITEEDDEDRQDREEDKAFWGSESARRIYEYSALESASHIRVLDLHKTSGSRLSCTIRHIEIGEEKYQALSYEWGNTDQNYRVLVHDATGNIQGHIALTSNLFSALKDMRDSEDLEHKTFWIDQICIAQHINQEKSHQVALMSKIFEKAHRVVTYLGPHSRDTEGEEGAFALADMIMKHVSPALREIAMTMPNWATSNPALVPYMDIPPEIDRNVYWPDLLKIVFSGWAHRLWMVQENVLCADTVMLRGRKVLSWMSIGIIPVLFRIHLLRVDYFLEPFWHHVGLDTVAMDACCAAAETWRLRIMHQYTDERFREPYIWYLGSHIFAFNDMKCQDPRDRVYSMLGIMSDSKQVPIEPDYNKPIDDVFLDTSIAVYEGHKSMNFLIQLGSMDVISDETRPSWVLREAPIIEVFIPTTGHAHPSYDSILSFSDDKKTLSVRGQIVDEVQTILPLRSDKITGKPKYAKVTADASRRALGEMKVVTMLFNEFGADIRTMTDIYDTLTFGVPLPAVQNDVDAAVGLWTFMKATLQYLFHWNPHMDKEDWYTTKVYPCLVNMTEILKAKGYDINADPQAVLAQEHETIRQQMNGTIIEKGRMLGITSKDYMSNLPDQAKVGDKVALFSGGSSLFILRPVGDGTYRFVGGGYSINYSYGQVYRDVNPMDVDYDIKIV